MRVKNSELRVRNPAIPDSVLHAVVPQTTVEGAPSIRNLLAVTRVNIGEPFTYYFGALLGPQR